MVQKLYFDGGAAVALSVPRCTLRYYIILLGSVSVQVWMKEYDEICGNIGVPAVFRLVSALEATPCVGSLAWHLNKESQYQSITLRLVWE